MISFFLMPLLSSYSRKNEFEADNYAKVFTDRKDLVSSLLKLYRGNLSLIKSSKLYSTFYYSHPSVFDRINNLEKNDKP
jgi:STE24 endopeptidase